MSGKRQSALNTHFAEAQADFDSRVSLIEDTILAMEKTLTALLEDFQANSLIAEDAPFVQAWRDALEELRTRGLPSGPIAGEAPAPGIPCPSCASVLRNVTGAKGDRCDWCGYIFPLRCPACEKELENIEGVSGDVCLWCQHRFA